MGSQKINCKKVEDKKNMQIKQHIITITTWGIKKKKKIHLSPSSPIFFKTSSVKISNSLELTIPFSAP